MIVLRVRTFAAVRICCSSVFQVPRRLDAHEQDVALLAGHRVARLDFGDVFQASRRIIRLRRIQRGDRDERRQHVPECLGVDAGAVPGHHVARLQAPHPRLHRRHRQPRGGGQVRQRGSAVGDELAHQGAVDLVEAVGRLPALRHGRTLSDGSRRMSTPEIPTWQLRARFAAALSAMYGAEVPAYTTLVEVSEAVNRDYVAAHPEAERLGSLDRVTAERHGAIRVGSAGRIGRRRRPVRRVRHVPGRLLRPARRRLAGSGGVDGLSTDRLR